MSNLQVAESRRLSEVQRLHKIIVRIDRDVAAGPMGANGYPDEYRAKRVIEANAERERLLSEIDALNALEGDELIKRFNPPTPPVEPVPLRDLLGRGDYGPQQVIVSRTPPPVVRHGGDPAPARPGAPEGWTSGETFYPDYSGS